MVERLNPLIQELQENGWIDEAELTKDLAKLFRKLGVPEHFSRPVEEIQQEIAEVVVAPESYMEELINILSSVHPERGKPILTQELAITINKRVGQYLEDDIKVRNLEVTKHVRGAERVAGIVKSQYNRILYTFSHDGYSTLGAIRNNEIDREPIPDQSYIYHLDIYQRYQVVLAHLL